MLFKFPQGKYSEEVKGLIGKDIPKLDIPIPKCEKPKACQVCKDCLLCKTCEVCNVCPECPETQCPPEIVCSQTQCPKCETCPQRTQASTLAEKFNLEGKLKQCMRERKSCKDRSSKLQNEINELAQREIVVPTVKPMSNEKLQAKLETPPTIELQQEIEQGTDCNSPEIKNHVKQYIFLKNCDSEGCTNRQIY